MGWNKKILGEKSHNMAPKIKLWSPGTPEISGVPGSSKKQKFIDFPYLQKLFSKSWRQMAREIKAPHKKKNTNNLKLS